MKKCHILMLALSFLIMGITAQPRLSVIESPELGISFESDSEWDRVSLLDTNLLEIRNKNRNLDLKIWHESCNHRPDLCLNSLFRREGIAELEGPFHVEIDHIKCRAMLGLKNEFHRPVKTIFISLPASNGYYILQFSCPYECFDEHKEHLNELLQCIRIIRNANNQDILAEKKVHT